MKCQKELVLFSVDSVMVNQKLTFTNAEVYNELLTQVKFAHMQSYF